MTNSWFSLVSALIGIAGTILAIIFYFAQRRDVRPYFHAASSVLISETPGSYAGLTVEFEGQEIRSFTSTRIAVWNQGRETINGGDVAPASPLRVAIGERAQLLAAKVIHVSHSSTQFRISKTRPNCVFLDFEYLDHHDGGVIEILHTGKSDAISVMGRIKGFGDIRTKNPSWPWRLHFSPVWNLFYNLASMTVAVMLLLVGRQLWMILPSRWNIPATILLGISVIFLILATQYLIESSALRPVPRDFQRFMGGRG